MAAFGWDEELFLVRVVVVVGDLLAVKLVQAAASLVNVLFHRHLLQHLRGNVLLELVLPSLKSVGFQSFGAHSSPMVFISDNWPGKTTFDRISPCLKIVECMAHALIHRLEGQYTILDAFQQCDQLTDAAVLAFVEQASAERAQHAEFCCQ